MTTYLVTRQVELVAPCGYDYNLVTRQVEFDRIVDQADGSSVERVVKRSLFAVGNLYPQKKVITFNKHMADFDFRVNYGDMSEYMPPSKIR